MSRATFVIATYQDTETLKDTLKSLQSTVNSSTLDFIVVDDGNTVKEQELKEFNVRLLSNPQRMGVGYSLDRGVRESQTEIVFVLGNDIRFQGRWLPRFLQVTKDNPKSIIATTTAGLNQNQLKMENSKSRYHAAHTLFEVTEKNNKRVLPFRRYLEGKWNKQFETPGVHQVGCLMGAFYSLHKSFYEQVSPWYMHRTWGSLEPAISIAYYLHGGNCLVDTESVTGHIFKSASSNKPVRDLIFNKLMIAYCMLPIGMEKIVYDWVLTLNSGQQALNIAKNHQKEFDQYRQLKNSLNEKDLINRLKPTGLFDDYGQNNLNYTMLKT